MCLVPCWKEESILRKLDQRYENAGVDERQWCVDVSFPVHQLQGLSFPFHHTSFSYPIYTYLHSCPSSRWVIALTSEENISRHCVYRISPAKIVTKIRRHFSGTQCRLHLCFCYFVVFVQVHDLLFRFEARSSRFFWPPANGAIDESCCIDHCFMMTELC